MRRRGAWALAAGLTAGLLVAGCGDDDEGDTATAPGAAETQLTVTLDADGEGGEAARTETISCEPGSGCAEGLEEISDEDFQPVPPDAACTKIYGGPDVVTIEGTLRGEPVEAELNRLGGCEIERFQRFAPLLQSLFPGYRPGAELKPPK